MRAVYRGDLDGTVCAAMLIYIGLCDETSQAHPKDMQDKKVKITKQDILCNLPYHPECHMWFDHHSSEIQRGDFHPDDFQGSVELAPSTAGLVYKYFLPQHPELKRFEQVVDATDHLDSADLTLEQVLNPTGTILLGFLLDPRSGLGLSRDFSISNFEWSSQLPELLAKHSIDEILAMPDSQERVQRYSKMQESAAEFYGANSQLDGNVIITDVRGKDIPPANRFLIYTLPGLEEGNVSVRIADGKKGEFSTIAVAHSIFNRTSEVDCGEVCKRYGGGGHRGAATCQPSIAEADRVLKEIIAVCKE
ncbi:MAG: exopolyphosphatase [Fidelibacterota bacterium]|nr:MAG: exopolyphosphatase [Candidatus Neomarinimicrobiota bacterium]